MEEDIKQVRHEYYLRNRERLCVNNREYRNKFKVVTHTRPSRIMLILNKPPRVNICQICANLESRAYHHWDDSHPERGFWVCLSCHALANRCDLKLHEVYLDLKKTVVESESEPIYKETQKEKSERLVNKIRLLYWEDQLSQKEIATRLGFKKAAGVHYYMKKFGIPRRTVSEGLQLRWIKHHALQNK